MLSPASAVFFFFFFLHFPPLMLGKRRAGRGPLGLIPLQRCAASFSCSKTSACKQSCPEDVDDSLHKHSGRHPGGQTLLRHPIGSDTWPCTVASPAGCLAAVWGYCWSRHGPLVCPTSLKRTGTFMKDQLCPLLLCLDLLVLKKDFANNKSTTDFRAMRFFLNIFAIKMLFMSFCS